MNSSTDSSGSNESGQNRRSTVSCRTKRDFFRFVSTFFGFLYFFRFEHLQCSNAILCNFSDPEVSWYEEGIGMNSSTSRVAAMKAAETADQQSRVEQKAIFSVCFYFFGFVRFFGLRNSSKASLIALFVHFVNGNLSIYNTRMQF